MPPKTKCRKRNCDFHAYYVPQGGMFNHDLWHYTQSQRDMWVIEMQTHSDDCMACLSDELCSACDMMLEMVSDLEVALKPW